jgi:hypothetical protein
MAKDNHLQIGEITNQIEWLEPKMVGEYLKDAAAAATLIEKLTNLKKTFFKGRRPKRDLKKLGDELDELRKALETVCVLMTKSTASHTKFVEAFARLVRVLGNRQLSAALSAGLANVNKLVTIVLSHENRLNTLEAPIVPSESKKGRKGKRKGQRPDLLAFKSPQSPTTTAQGPGRPAPKV